MCTNSAKVFSLGVHISAVVDPGFKKGEGVIMDAYGRG